MEISCSVTLLCPLQVFSAWVVGSVGACSLIRRPLSVRAMYSSSFFGTSSVIKEQSLLREIERQRVKRMSQRRESLPAGPSVNVRAVNAVELALEFRAASDVCVRQICRIRACWLDCRVWPCRTMPRSKPSWVSQTALCCGCPFIVCTGQVGC